MKNTTLAIPLFLAAFPLILMGIGLYCCSYSRGFNIDKISSKLAYDETWETKTLSFYEKDHLLNVILNQPFYQCGSGNQCYAFASQDGKYVIKFFKMHKILPKHWLRVFPFSLFEKYAWDNVEKRQNLLENIFRSFKTAYEKLREESGLIYIHLNKTRELKKVTVFGYDAKKYSIDLDSKEFIVQLKAQKICDAFLTFKESADEEMLHTAVRSFFELIAARCQRGYGDSDTSIRNNFGFVEQRAIFMDCGHLYADDSLKYPHSFQAEILNATEKLSQWAEQYYPDLANVLQEEAQGVIDKYLK